MGERFELDVGWDVGKHPNTDLFLLPVVICNLSSVDSVSGLILSATGGEQGQYERSGNFEINPLGFADEVVGNILDPKNRAEETKLVEVLGDGRYGEAKFVITIV